MGGESGHLGGSWHLAAAATATHSRT
uniref:Uncharacterized protein n=1 Tax=Arundo donax TaxID=35708 RepID=A0A0A9AQH0_ARUDO